MRSLIQLALTDQDRARQQHGWRVRLAKYGDRTMTAGPGSDRLELHPVHVGYQNSFEPVAAVEIEPLPTGGSRIRLSPRLSTRGIGASITILAIAIVAGLLTIWTHNFIPLVTIPGAIGYILSGRGKAVRELAFVRDWVAWCVDAPSS